MYKKLINFLLSPLALLATFIANNAGNSATTFLTNQPKCPDELIK
ncbi:cyclic lactone autoinducer peptide [Senegalia massiliensis]|uniref:Cyclic lactone autoinducer peptide n=1 Tax=Senegalia massiliensis TaxID=1720316 RepID=A0A845QWA7_9CLOT|nr:cyclic lactone autoinducer peptide [Senegalia massiliensis]NBI06795.1 cyclic lactone autoinducer peptide [Senegalia massiliensis]